MKIVQKNCRKNFVVLGMAILSSNNSAIAFEVENETNTISLDLYVEAPETFADSAEIEGHQAFLQTSLPEANEYPFWSNQQKRKQVFIDIDEQFSSSSKHIHDDDDEEELRIPSHSSDTDSSNADNADLIQANNVQTQIIGTHTSSSKKYIHDDEEELRIPSHSSDTDSSNTELVQTGNDQTQITSSYSRSTLLLSKLLAGKVGQGKTPKIPSLAA
ncbi:MAG: hypothetical protein AAGA46_09475 [Cyanobacteria bacterium P01_F01_bin.13]